MENVSVKIWSKTVSYLDLIDVFHFSNVSKFFFAVAQSNKTLLKKKHMSNHILSYDPDLLIFINQNLIELSKILGNE